MHTTFRSQETESLQESFPAQLLPRGWFKQAALGQEICDYTSFAFLLAHLGLPGNKPNHTRKVLERVSKRESQLLSLLSVIAASDNKAWKAVVAKNAREGSLGTPLAKFHTLSFWYIFWPGSLTLCLTAIFYVLIFLCNPQWCRHLGHIFLSGSKRSHVPGEAAACKLFSTLQHGFPKRLMLSVQLLPF